MAIPNAAQSSNTPSARSQFNSGQAGGQSLLWTFTAFVAAYLIWAVVQQHEKVRSQIEPSNIAFNLHNLVMIALSVIVSLGLLKIFLAKAIGWGLPGADTVATIVEFAA